MHLRTDGELRDKWEETQRLIKRLKNRDDSASAQKRRDLAREQDLIAIEWNELVRLKKQGILTDRSRVDLAIKTAKETSILYGIPLTFSENEGPRGENHIARFWWLSATYSGVESEFRDPRFIKFAVAATEEMMELALLVLLNPPAVADGDEPDDDDFDEPDRYMVLGHITASGARVVMWPVDISMWEGPLRNRRNEWR